MHFFAQLVNPLGFGPVVGLCLLLPYAVVAAFVAARAYPSLPTAPYKNRWPVSLVGGVGGFTSLITVLCLLLPIRSHGKVPPYGEMVPGLVGGSILLDAFGVALVVMAVSQWRRRYDSAWHMPFFTLAGAMAVLNWYLASGFMDRARTYQLRAAGHYDLRDTAPWWSYYILLGLLVVITVNAVAMSLPAWRARRSANNSRRPHLALPRHYSIRRFRLTQPPRKRIPWWFYLQCIGMALSPAPFIFHYPEDLEDKEGDAEQP